MSTTLLRSARGKCQRLLLGSAASCQPGGCRILVTDQITKQRFLVDSGSDICCYPQTIFKVLARRHLSGSRRSNRSTIKMYGLLRQHIQLKNLGPTFIGMLPSPTLLNQSSARIFWHVTTASRAAATTVSLTPQWDISYQASQKPPNN